MKLDKIDFVITWVDGNDENWLKEKNRYTPDKNSDARNNRYRDWENLKYWFRGVEKFASWVNKIYFVTWGHIPSWLNTENEKLIIVKHEDFIPKEYLPTFNSNCIELNLYRIEGLSENFVNFNDDMFLTNYVSPTDFFKNGKPRDSAILSPIISYDKDGFSKLLQNNMAIINTNFVKNDVIKSNFLKWFNIKYKGMLLRTICMMPWKRFTGFLDIHLAASLTKNTYEKVWKIEKEDLETTCNSKFRNNCTEVNEWLIRYWQICEGNFYPRKIKFGKYFEYGKDSKIMYESIEKQRYKMVCLNDVDRDYNFEIEKQKTINTFEKILPEKSTFER